MLEVFPLICYIFLIIFIRFNYKLRSLIIKCINLLQLWLLVLVLLLLLLMMIKVCTFVMTLASASKTLLNQNLIVIEFIVVGSVALHLLVIVFVDVCIPIRFAKLMVLRIKIIKQLYCTTQLLIFYLLKMHTQCWPLAEIDYEI